MSDIIKSVLLRFVRAGVAGAVSTMVVIVPLSNTWGDLKGWLSALSLAGIIGFITGLLQAVDKYLRSTPEVVK